MTRSADESSFSVVHSKKDYFKHHGKRADRRDEDMNLNMRSVIKLPML